MPSCCNARVDFQVGDMNTEKQECHLHFFCENSHAPFRQEHLTLRSDAPRLLSRADCSLPQCLIIIFWRLELTGIIWLLTFTSCWAGRIGFHLCLLGQRVRSHRLTALCPAFTPHDTSHRKAINSYPLFHPKHNRNMSILLQSCNYFFSENNINKTHHI